MTVAWFAQPESGARGFAIAINKPLPFAGRVAPREGNHFRACAIHLYTVIGSFEDVKCHAIFWSVWEAAMLNDESRFLAAIQILPPYSGVRRRDHLLDRMNSLGVRVEELEESFSRSRGPGGQHVNKVSSAATIRHRPTGLTVTASDSRSQAENRRLALGRLLDLLERRIAKSHRARLAAVSKTRRQNPRAPPNPSQDAGRQTPSGRSEKTQKQGPHLPEVRLRARQRAHRATTGKEN